MTTIRTAEATDATRSSSHTARPLRRWAYLPAALIAGAAASLPFGYIYLARPQAPHWSQFAIVFGGLFVGGAGYALLLTGVRRPPRSVHAAAAAGLALVAASVLGIAVGFGAEPGLGGLPLPIVFGLIFPPIVGSVALVYGLVLGGTLRLDGAARAATVSALAAWLVALAVVVATDPWPGWRVGGGDRAMIKVAWLATLLGGAAAGTLYLALAGRGGADAVDADRPMPGAAD
jgi:hypothetical protein